MVNAAAVLALLAALGLEIAVRVTPLPDLARVASHAQFVTDRSGTPLWFFLAADDRLRFPADVANVDPLFLDLLIAYEDQRFFNHRGVDPVAVGRALWQAAREGRIVSGASTITMQTVRLLDPQPRTVSAKLDEMLRAIRLERAYSKEQILSLYLTLAPYGGNIEGLRAASLAYFGKEPRTLSPGEASMLVALPRAPEALRPDRHPDAAIDAGAAVLARVEERLKGAKPDSIATTGGLRHPAPSAPHLAARMRRDDGSATEIRTNVDTGLQHEVEAIAGSAVAGLDPGVSAAIVVVRIADSSVAAYAGGSDFFDERRSGQVDLADALRSPGSALKPFIYGLAFERLVVHPDTIIADAPVRFGDYEPENFDGGFLGEMTVREALVRSVNTTAVAILQAVGPSHLMARLRSVGAPLVTENADDEAGLAVALGGGGMTLATLTNLYAGLGRGGVVHALRYRADDPPGKPLRLLSKPAAGAIADILADTQPPPGTGLRLSADGGRRIAFKTGTSYGFRDAWAVGFDNQHAVGVWIGRPDGGPHLGSYGITAAAPVMFRVFDALPVPARAVDAGLSPGPLARGTALPQRLRRFDTLGHARDFVILFPRDDSVVSLSDGDPSGVLPIEVYGGTPPYQWFVDGSPLSNGPRPEASWRPEGGGQYELTVVDGIGRTARSSFWLDPPPAAN
jgi:penicillin-binding protein 1C